MSQILIQQHLNQFGDFRRVGGTDREAVVREAFKDLLKGWGRARTLVFVPEYGIEAPHEAAALRRRRAAARVARAVRLLGG